MNDIKETTFQNYVRTLGVIRNLFEDIQLKDLNDIVVQKKIDEYAETHSRKTTHEVLLKIKTALRDAYARGYIANDFARLVKLVVSIRQNATRHYPLQTSRSFVITSYSIQKMNLMYLYYLHLKQVCDVENYLQLNQRTFTSTVSKLGIQSVLLLMIRL